MSEQTFSEAAYALLIGAARGDDDALSSVLDALMRDDRAGADQELGLYIGFETAHLRMLLALRSASTMQDLAAIERIVALDSTDIADWPDPLER